MENAPAQDPPPHLPSDEIIKANLLSNVQADTTDACDIAMERTIARYGSEKVVNIARGMSLAIQLAVKRVVGEKAFNPTSPTASTPDSSKRGVE